MITNLKTPGVYIDEVNAFPNSVVQVETAVPAFIGYTPQASYEGKSYLFKPVLINSMAEFMAIFAYPADPTTQQYPPQYTRGLPTQTQSPDRISLNEPERK